MRIKQKLSTLFLALAIMPVIILGYLIYCNARDNIKNEVFNKLSAVTTLKAAQLERFLNDCKNDLLINQNRFVVKANLPVLEQLDSDRTNPDYIHAKETIDAQLRMFQTYHSYANIMLVDSKGKVIYVSNPDCVSGAMDKPLSLPDKSAFEKAKKENYIGGIYKTSDKIYRIRLPFVGAVNGLNGKFAGVIVLELDMEKIYRFVNENTGLGDSGESLLVTKVPDNRILFISHLRFDPKAILVKTVVPGQKSAIPAQNAVTGKEGIGLSIDYRGVSVVSAWRYIPSMGWGLVSKVDLKEALRSVAELKNWIIVINVFILVAALIISWLLSKSISDPIQQLQIGTAIIGRGNLDYKVFVKTNDEIRELAESFNAMADNIKRSYAMLEDRVTEKTNELSSKVKELEDTQIALLNVNDDLSVKQAELSASEQRFRGAFETSAIGTALYALDGRYIQVNDALCDILGYSKDELMEKYFQDVTHPEDLEVSIELARKLMNGKIPFYHVEKRYIHKEGRVVWINLGVALVRDAADRPLYFVAQIQDITERKKVEESLTKANSFNKAIVSTIPFGMDIVDKEGTILFMNKKLMSMFGKNAIGRKCWEIYKDNGMQCPDCPINKDIEIGTTSALEVNGCLDGKVLEITHTGMIYEGRPAVLEIFADITERKVGEENLRKANEELRKLDQLKSEFVGTVSHELRTPMSIIKEGVSQVLEGLHGQITENQKKFLGIALNNIDRLNYIVNDLLDISKIESGRMALIKEESDIVSLVRAASYNFHIVAAGKDLKIKEDLPAGKIKVRVDKDKIIQVFTNLINNAIKFTKQGTIEVSVKDKGDHVECSVSDTGIGIAQENLPKVFTKFQQFSRISGPGMQGTGLGLVICKNLVELHDGKIWLESELGKGTKVIFTLPK